jgi:hypothetical protein
MCTQTWTVYRCGCKNKGQFEQCDELYNLKSQCQCAVTAEEDTLSRNYCSDHMPKVNKALDEYRRRHARGKLVSILLFEGHC